MSNVGCRRLKTIDTSGAMLRFFVAPYSPILTQCEFVVMGGKFGQFVLQQPKLANDYNLYHTLVGLTLRVALYETRDLEYEGVLKLLCDRRMCYVVFGRHS